MQDKYTYENGWMEVLDFAQIKVDKYILTIVDIPYYISMEEVTKIESSQITATLINAYVNEYCSKLDCDMFVFYSDIVEIYSTPENIDSELDLKHETQREAHLVH